MRLIDADAFLIDSIKEKQFFIYREDALNDVFVVNTVYGDLKKALANMPTIDAVEVVRCKDCYFGKRLNSEMVLCVEEKLCPTRTSPDFFCASGKCKMDAEVEG